MMVLGAYTKIQDGLLGLEGPLIDSYVEPNMES